MKVELGKWNYEKPEKRLRQWVLAIVAGSEDTIPMTTKDILAIYENGARVYQWAELEI